MLCRVQRPSVELQLHADVDGSLEALTECLLALNTGHIIFKVVKASVGAPSTADVQFARTTGSTLVAFSVPVPANVRKEANQAHVSIVESKCAHLLTPVKRMRTVLWVSYKQFAPAPLLTHNRRAVSSTSFWMTYR
jgi:translation initiation factor IF-2